MNPNDPDFLGGLFDFNGDGHTDMGEMFIAYKMFEEVTQEDGTTNDSDEVNSDDY